MQITRSSEWPKHDQVGIIWLGQAGFWLNTGHHSILIDPYLSDSLAKKYTGKKNDHKRMVPIPIAPADLPRPDLILVTHAHTDHMDSETLKPLVEAHKGLKVIVPKSKLEMAQERIGENAELVGVDADDIINIDDKLSIHVFPAAHETLAKDESGQHEYLGYGIEDAGLKIYHSGDTIPFNGLQERVDKFAPDIALLPVNGRDALRLSEGIPGNLTLEEAYSLVQDVPIFIPHHWGMFAFNTFDPKAIIEFSKGLDENNIVLPSLENHIVISGLNT